MNSFSHNESRAASEFQNFLIDSNGEYGDDIHHGLEVIHAPDPQDESELTEHERRCKAKTEKLARRVIDSAHNES